MPRATDAWSPRTSASRSVELELHGGRHRSAVRRWPRGVRARQRRRGCGRSPSWRSSSSVKDPCPSPGRARPPPRLPSLRSEVQLSWAMDVVNYQDRQPVVAFAAGPAAAGAYELANRVASAARQFALYPSSALLPALAAEYAQTGAEVLHAQYRRATRIIVGCAFPILVFCAAVAPLLLNAWRLTSRRRQRSCCPGCR